MQLHRIWIEEFGFGAEKLRLSASASEPATLGLFLEWAVAEVNGNRDCPRAFIQLAVDSRIERCIDRRGRVVGRIN